MDRYQDITIIRNRNQFVGTIGDKYYKTVYYPEISPSETDIYVQTEFGDRLDLLANRFYGDTSLYWIISICNPNVLSFGSLFPPVGAQLRIPVNVSGIVSNYNQLNEL